MLIDGKWVESVSGKTFESRNPSNGELLALAAVLYERSPDHAWLRSAVPLAGAGFGLLLIGAGALAGASVAAAGLIMGCIELTGLTGKFTLLMFQLSGGLMWPSLLLAGATLAAFEPTTAQQVFGKAGKWDSIDVVADNGVISCLDARSGEFHWQERLGGGVVLEELRAGGSRDVDIFATRDHTPYARGRDQSVAEAIAALGGTLFQKYLLPFEIVSVLLLVAMVGVILLSKKELK